MNDEDKFPFDVDYQKKLLNILVKDVDFLLKSIRYLKPIYFETDALKWTFNKIVEYYNKYQKAITFTVFANELNFLKEKNDSRFLEYTAFIREIIKLEVTEKEYIIDKLTEFIQRNIFVQAFKNSGDYYNNNKVNDAIAILQKGLDSIKEVNFDKSQVVFFMDELTNRIAKRDQVIINQKNYKYTTGILELDELIGGGLSKGEMIIIVADSGVGKSIGLIHLGSNNVLSLDASVLHFSLEGRLNQVEDRYEARLNTHNYRDIVNNQLPMGMQGFYKKLGNKLVICNLADKWDYTVVDLENIIKELRSKNFIPDVIVVDYGDLLNPISKKESSYADQEETFRGLHTLGVKYNAVIATASQMQRAPKDKNPRTDPQFLYTRQNLADSYAKLRIADVLITLNRTEQEKLSNLMRVYVDKVRDSESGKIINIKTDYSKMIFCAQTNIVKPV